MDEYRQLQVAFLKSGTTGLEIPTDHAIKSVTYQTARKWGILTILNGTNIATESHATAAWTQGHVDWMYIKSIGERFGVKLQSFPHYTIRDRATWMKKFWWLNLLDYTDYHREKAIAELAKMTGYESYGFKHGESRITRFLHGYIIPRRFGWDTRRSRVSSMVMSGQLTRDEALTLLAKPVYTSELLEEDRRIVLKTMGITDSEFEDYMNLPLKSFWDYPSYTKTIRTNPILRVAREVYRTIKR